MTLTTTRARTLEFRCDNCGTCFDTGCFRLELAREALKDAGWRFYRDIFALREPWRHKCSACA